MCLIAVKRHPETLAYIYDQTDDICLAAVKSSGFALKYVKNRTYELDRAADKQLGWKTSKRINGVLTELL